MIEAMYGLLEPMLAIMIMMMMVIWRKESTEWRNQRNEKWIKKQDQAGRQQVE